MKDTFQQLLFEMLGRFTGLPAEKIDTELELALHVLNDWVDTDRCVLYVFSADRRNLVLHCQTHDDAFAPEAADTLQRTWFTSVLAAGNVVAKSWLPEELPAEAVDERTHAQNLGIKSIFAVPIAVAGEYRYVLAANTFHEHRSWNEKIVDRFRLVGQLFANVLHRKDEEQTLRTQLDEFRSREQTAREHHPKNAEGWNHDRFGIVGQSPAIVHMLDRAAVVAPMPTTVLLLGETGTGKELFAWAIHERSTRRGKAFVKVNCPALPPSLIESEFFGHEKGAFTGAIAAHAGRFELADGGTIFLDEIGDLPLELQPKLLRLLQDGEVHRIGSNRARRTDVRIIAATNQNLTRAIAEGRFRKDLYYRLSVFPIELPPLRERKEDIPLIARTFVEQRQTALGRRIEEIPAEVMDTLVEYDWPGNVRELENVLERAIILSPGKTLRLDDELLVSGESFTESAEQVRDESFDTAARDHVHAVLERCGWRINGPGGAAEVLAVHPNTLRARLKKLGLARPMRG